MSPPHPTPQSWGGQIFPTESTDSMLVSSGHTFSSHTLYDTLPALWDSLSPAKSMQNNHHSNQHPSCGRTVMCLPVFFNRIKSLSISSLDKQMANPLSVKMYLSVSSLGIGSGLPSPTWSHLVLTESLALTGCSVNGDRM